MTILRPLVFIHHIIPDFINHSYWSVGAIETQLAHTEHNKVREVYNNALYLPERTRMIQWWADELDRLASQGINKS